MATSGPTNLPAFFNTDADFRTWVDGIKAALLAIGLVQTADTGQIDTATVAKPTGVSTVMGYQIFRFNDTLQATKPVYLKISYGSGPTSAARPGLLVQTAVSTNGAGTLTVVASGQFQVFQNATESAGAVRPMYVSGDSGRVTFVGNYVPSTDAYALIFHIERTKDDDGTPNGDGLMMMGLYRANNNPSWQMFLHNGTGAAKADSYGPGANPGQGGQASVKGTEVALERLKFYNGRPMGSSLFSYVQANITALTQFNIVVDGVSRTYLALGAGSYPQLCSHNYNSPVLSLAIPWD